MNYNALCVYTWEDLHATAHGLHRPKIAKLRGNKTCVYFKIGAHKEDIATKGHLLYSQTKALYLQGNANTLLYACGCYRPFHVANGHIKDA